MSDHTRPRPIEPDGMPAARPLPVYRTAREQTASEIRGLAGRVKRGPLSRDEVAEIRLKIVQGVYAGDDVLEAVAGRLLDSGDLRRGA